MSSRCGPKGPEAEAAADGLAALFAAAFGEAN